MKRLLCVALLLGLLSASAEAITNSTINTTQRWAWAASAGWINCRTDATNGAAIGTYICSGYFYSPVSGWIHLGDGTPSNGIRYTSTTNDYGVNHDGAGHLSGFAWAPSSGWISFEWTNAEAADAPKINLKNGTLTGFAWSESLGYIGLSNLSAFCKTDRFASAADSNTNGIADAWELETTGSLGALSTTNDADGDGLTDYEEYVADTDPLSAGSSFVFTSITSGSTNITLTWPCSEGRLYKVETRASLTNAAGWVNAGLLISTNTTTASVTLPASLSTQTFYRIRAVLPLTP